MIHFIKAGDGDFSAKMKPTRVLPSGKHTKNNGKSTFFYGKAIGKPWENHWKIVIYMENQHHFSLIQTFRHFSMASMSLLVNVYQAEKRNQPQICADLQGHTRHSQFSRFTAEVYQKDDVNF